MNLLEARVVGRQRVADEASRAEARGVASERPRRSGLTRRGLRWADVWSRATARFSVPARRRSRASVAGKRRIA
jgi:hypothetical protein